MCPTAGLDFFLKEANVVLLPGSEPRSSSPQRSQLTMSIHMKSYRYWWSRKTPPQHISPKTSPLHSVLQKVDNEPDSQTKPTWTVPNSLFPNTSVHTMEGERERGGGGGEGDGHEAEKQILSIKDVGKTGRCNGFI